MLGFLVILSIVNTVLLVWNLLVLNAGFETTNSNIDASLEKVGVLTKKCDEIVMKYKLMVNSIDESK